MKIIAALLVSSFFTITSFAEALPWIECGTNPDSEGNSVQVVIRASTTINQFNASIFMNGNQAAHYKNVVILATGSGANSYTTFGDEPLKFSMQTAAAMSANKLYTGHSSALTATWKDGGISLTHAQGLICGKKK
jgi:hypothetical protein